MAAASRTYIGLMSGTSLDGIDGVLVEFDEPGARDGTELILRTSSHVHVDFAPALAAELLELNAPGPDEIHRAALAANALSRSGAEVVESLLAAARQSRRGVAAIGSHGQTVRHRPLEFDGTGYTVQLNNPALLAELTGIDVIADFRSRDVAAGGQGAPLVPAFHRAAFATGGRSLVVLNLGGMANVTVLEAEGSTLGFDCGPGNVLLDDWCQREQGLRFDDDGAWARSGSVDRALLDAFLADPYFSAAPPKSTGRDHFNRSWLQSRLDGDDARPRRPADVQATLTELTAATCAQAIDRHGRNADRVLVCGGGALNSFLLERLGLLLPGRVVRSSDAAGVPPEQVEACAFAWLAYAWHRRSPGNLQAVTGAAGPRVLGALYPAS